MFLVYFYSPHTKTEKHIFDMQNCIWQVCQVSSRVCKRVRWKVIYYLHTWSYVPSTYQILLLICIVHINYIPWITYPLHAKYSSYMHCTYHLRTSITYPLHTWFLLVLAHTVYIRYLGLHSYPFTPDFIRQTTHTNTIEDISGIAYPLHTWFLLVYKS